MDPINKPLPFTPFKNFSGKLINEINALAHKKKTVGLTPEEQVRQQKLRQKYLKEFRRGFEQQLQSIKVVDANGNDVTPAKARMHKKIN